MKVKFTGCSEAQAKWGSCTGNHNSLSIGTTYELDHTEPHSWHTKVFLVGVEGSFNSVCFEEANDGE